MGCWAIGGVWRFLDIPGGWGEVDDTESIRTVQVALASGITFFDTAATYGTGHSETILGRALAGQRHKAIIATKFGWCVHEDEKQVTRYDHPRMVIDHLSSECERSLARLATDYIDLYQLHVWDYPLEAIPDLLEALEKLVEAGKIRAYGWSTDDVEGARVFAQGAHGAAIQHDLNVVRGAPDMLALCAQLNLASINRSPLARGALTGKYSQHTTFAENDVRRDQWSWDTFFAPTLRQLDALRDILTSDGRTLTQGALAWIWAVSERTVPIPGIRNVQQAQENIAAMRFGPLNAAQMRQIDEVLRHDSPAS
jgi:aryl-alcohol dehydrogenase-like predicted oxidoreductase